jgi:hypothetical protein
MKSSSIELRRRGYIEDLDINSFSHLSVEQIYDMIHSKKAHERTIAVRLLGKSDEFAQSAGSEVLLNTLMFEKSLYTKIEICSVLEKQGVETANKMFAFLGKIGNNQHRCLPKEVSQKSSYPLPRDIIARTLGKMNIEVLPAMIEALDCQKLPVVRELIDAIGFICFYNNTVDEDLLLNKLLMCFDNYHDDDIIRWKIVMAFSAFQNEKIVIWLENISKKDDKALIRNEAKRSLKLVAERTGGRLGKSVEPS